MSRVLSADDGHMKIKPELMKDDTLYHCIVGDKLMLVYCDSQKVMHCYEVEDTQLVESVRACANYEDAARLLEQIGAQKQATSTNDAKNL